MGAGSRLRMGWTAAVTGWIVGTSIKWGVKEIFRPFLVQRLLYLSLDFPTSDRSSQPQKMSLIGSTKDVRFSMNSKLP